MQVNKLKIGRASTIAVLHVGGINTGFLSSLGEKFVGALYEAIGNSPEGFCFVAEENGKILGFVAFTESVGSLYKSVLKKNFIKFSMILAAKMLSWQRIKRVFQTLMYPSRISESDLPKAELLSIAVSPQARGKGVARKLIDAGFEECRRRGIDRVKVMVAAQNDAANRLYQKCGFEFHSQIDSHGVPSNIYVAEIGK